MAFRGFLLEHMDVPLLVPVDEARRDSTDVRACADEEKDDEEKRLKIE